MQKRIAVVLILLSACLVLTACYGKNYPGSTETKYWVSEDESIMFYFPAEAGHGNAQGKYMVDENTRVDLILEWDTRSGIVEVKTAGYENVFTARTTTNETDLTCTFEIISQEDGYNFPSTIVFNWKKSID